MRVEQIYRLTPGEARGEDAERTRTIAALGGKKPPFCPGNNKVAGAEGIRQIGRSDPRRSLLGSVSLLARLAVTKGTVERVSNRDPLQRFPSRTSYRVSRFIVE